MVSAIDVKKLREDLQITQKELAERCNVTLRTVQYWEMGMHLTPKAIKSLQKAATMGVGLLVNSEAYNNGVSVASGNGSNITLTNSNTERFFATLEKQQELMAKQLEELTQARILQQKKDYQIDTLLRLLNQNMEAQKPQQEAPKEPVNTPVVENTTNPEQQQPKQ